MHCKNCGHALSNNSAVCPNCGMLMTDDQMKRRKELNGYNNPYMQRLNEIRKNNLKYKLEQNDDTNINGAVIFILLGLLIVIIIAVIMYFYSR